MTCRAETNQSSCDQLMELPKQLRTALKFANRTITFRMLHSSPVQAIAVLNALRFAPGVLLLTLDRGLSGTGESCSEKASFAV